MDAPANNIQPSAWGWGWRAVTITNGQEVRWTANNGNRMSYNTAFWHWAVVWTEADMNNIADIDIRVVDTCPPGGGEVTLQSQSDRDLRNRITLLGQESWGRCLTMVAYGYSVPPGGRVIYSADHFAEYVGGGG
jgi:hypothetical protein